jgi:hypothetical protein
MLISAVYFISFLFPEGTQIMEENIVAVAACNGARKQSFHVDTKEKKAFSVLHILNARMFHITQFGEKPFKLMRGGIVVMKGNVCHAGAAHMMRRKSVLFHVPVGYTDTNTQACEFVRGGPPSSGAVPMRIT